MTKRLLFILTTALHTQVLFSHTLETQSSTQSTAATDLLISVTNDARLDTIADEFSNLCSTAFSVPTMSTTEKNDYQRFLLSWQKKHTDLMTTTDSAAADQRITLLDIFINALKNISLKFELLRIGKADDQAAFIQQPISAQALQTAHLTALLELNKWLNAQWTAPQIKYITAKEQTKIARMAIQSQPSALYKALEVDLYQDSPLLADKYLSFMQRYQQIKFVQDPKKYADLRATAQKLFEQCQEKEYELIAEGKTKTAKVIHLFSSKLLSLSQDIAFTQQLQNIANKQPALQELFMKHYLLVQSLQFKNLEYDLGPTEQTAIDTYLSATTYYFDHATEKTTAPVTFELKKAELLLKTIQDQRPEPGWIKDLLSGHIVYVYLKSAIDRLLHGKTNEAKTYQTMISILEDIQKQLSISDSFGAMLKNIVSGKWINDGSIKGVSRDTNGNVIVDFTNQLLGQQTFADFKTAATFALTYASPLILEKVLQYLSPQEKANDSSHEATNTGLKDQLLDLASKNPEFMQQVIQAHPEIIELCASSIKQLATKA